jgi:hypothetical protein
VSELIFLPPKTSSDTDFPMPMERFHQRAAGDGGTVGAVEVKRPVEG